MKNLFKFMRLCAVSLLLLFGISPNLWASSITSDGNAILFYEINAVTWWSCGTDYDCNHVYFYGTGGNAWVSGSHSYHNNTVYVVIPAGTWDHIILVRGKSTTTGWGNNNDNIYNKTGDIELSTGNNHLKTFAENETTSTWGNISFGLRGTLDWDNDIISLSPQSDGTYKGTISNHVATATSCEFKVKEGDNWYPNNNVKLDNLVVGATYDINCSFKLSDQSVSITSTQKTFSVTASSASSTMGSVSWTSKYIGSTGVSITATSETGYHFTSWSVTGGAVVASSTSATTNVTATATGTVKANFAANTHNLSWVTDGDALTGNYTHGDAIAYGTTIVAPDTPTKTGYTFAGWSNGSSVVTPAATMPDNDLTYTATWTEKTHTVTISNDGNGSTSPTGAQSNVGEVTGISITATPNDGFGFKEWVVTGGTVSAQSATTTFYPTADNATIQATFQSTAVYYDLTVGVCSSQSAAQGTVSSSPAAGTNIQAGTAFTITATPATGYEVEGWYSDAACTGTKLQTGGNTYSFSLSATTGVYVKFQETKYTINIETSTGVASVSPTNVSVGQITASESITATASDGYSLNGWTLGDGISITSGTNSPITIKATKAGTITAKATEITHTVTIENGTTSSTTAGVATEGTATVRELAADEKFTGWTIPAGVTLTQGTTTNSTTIYFHANANNLTVTANIGKKTLVKLYFANNNGWSKVAAYAYGNGEGNNNTWPGEEITSNTEVINCVTYYYFQYYTEDYAWTHVIFNNNQQSNGNQAADLTIADRASDYANITEWMSAPYDALWAFYIQGNEDPSKIEAQDYPVTDCENGTASVNLPANAQIKFKAHNKVTGKWYGCNNNDPISGTITDWEFFDQYDNKATNDSKMRTNDAGTYTFKVVATDDANKVKVSVTYPSAQTFAVTISAGDNGSVEPNGEQQVDAFNGISVTAKPNPGYRFKQWETSTGVTVTNSTSATTTVKASQAGTLQATFTTEGMIYFNKAGIKDKWQGDVYVYFYNGEYWDKDGKGSGSKTTDGGSCTSGPHKMNRLGNSDIYYYDYAGAGISKESNVISFTDKSLSNAGNFYQCSASYRTDFHTCANMFVPRDYIDYYNECAYYSKGYWRTFQSTDPGYDITIWNDKGGTGGEKAHGDFVGTSNLSNDFTFTATLDGNHTYGFKISSCGGTWYGNQGTMTQDCNWEFDSEGSYNNNCGLTTTSAGEYKFTLNCTDGWLRVSVEYPLSEGDYRLAYEELSGSDITKIHPTHHIKALRANDTKTDTVSFFVEQKANAYIYLQKCTKIEGTNITWTNESGKKVDLADFANEAGVYNFTLTQTKSGATLTPEVALLGAYVGPYYIRTDCAGGGWSSYDIADNKMTQTDILAQNTNGFDYYFVDWVAASTNVKYCIANNYSEALTDSLEGDTYIGLDKQVLPQDANVRFMWNSTNNQLSRAYISGSTNDADRYLMLINTNHKMWNIPAEEAEPAQIDELKFIDKNNWVYQADIQAQPGCAVKLTANYNNKVQYFIGADGEEEGSSKTIISSLTEGPTTTKYTMRTVYDFKTNLLVAGWIPNGTITSDIVLGGDMLITRTHQQPANQIVFDGDYAVSDIKHIYAVLNIQKDVMVGKEGTDYTTPATNQSYDRTMYWISFPFDVKISEVFGVDGYGKKWIMQRYNGERRAEIGWFAETETFWEYLAPTSTLQAYKGYLLILNANYFNTADADVWKNSATEANFYFPSASGEIGIISKDHYEQTVPAHPCGIERTFDFDNDHKNLSHTITDSHWNVIGVPAFQNKTMALSETEVDTKMNAIYEWNSSNNTYIVRALNANFEFRTMYAYMVQYTGTINWNNVSVVTTNSAPRYAYTDEKNYMVELFFNGNNAEDHTYINLADEANTDFVLNEDMMKIDNAGYPNIYSFAGNYNVAYNETKMDNQTVMLGVSAPKAGTYTFSMPKEFSGTAKLIDLVEGTTTDLNVANYSVDLEKGTYNNRFQLLLEVEAKAPTSMENVDCGWWMEDGKTTKLLRNGNIYLINAGRVYNVLGVEE